jgi:L-seryl-tRNA(Ser) seleniumtransferase
MAHSCREIPAVDKVMRILGLIDLPRPVILAAVRRELSAARREQKVPETSFIVARIRVALERLDRMRIRPVINATGIIAHTNLGRSPLASAALKAIEQAGASYSNLELSLDTGERGCRAEYLEHNLSLLCGAEAATAVNNCAAALVLVLRHFTRKKKDVVISRGELVQIGGGFRIPEILEASGAVLREVGTTNRTSISDYERALGPGTALILKVHRSNFFMGGFVESPRAEDLAAVAHKKALPIIEDLGSGAVFATEDFPGLEHEPTPAEILKKGVDIVTFSGDKLLGGPQAGIIAGRTKMVAALKNEPFFRALRCDKLVLAALQATVDLHLSGGAAEQIPVLKMLSLSDDQLIERAHRIVDAFGELPLAATVGHGKAQVGGGTLPRSSVPSVTIDLVPRNLTLPELASRLRAGSPPVVGYISGGKLRLDLRTVLPAQDEDLARTIRDLFTTGSPGA